MTHQTSQRRFMGTDDPGVTVTQGVGFVSVGFGTRIGTEYVRSEMAVICRDPDTLRALLDEALSKVVPMCMTDQQRIEDEL